MNESKTILLVEDEALIAMSEQMTLEKAGYKVIQAGSGEKAIEAVQTNPDINLILMDIDLGKGMNGPEAAVSILQDRDLPVVFLSSHTEPEIVGKTEKITSYGYIVKNSGDTVLLASIKMAFKLFNAKMATEETEKALRKSEDKYRSVVENAIEAICVIQDERFCFSNPEANRLFGYSEDELRLLDPDSTIHPDDRERVGSTRREILKGKNFKPIVSHRIMTRDQRVLWVEIKSTIIDWNGKPAMLVFLTDITARKQAEEDLHNKNETLNTILNAVPQSIFWKDKAGFYLGCNQPFADAVGIDDPAQIVGLTDFDLPWPKEAAEAYRADDREVIESNAPKRHIIEPLERFDKTRLIIDISKIPLLDSKGIPSGVLGVYEDVTERKRVEQELVEQKKHFERVTSASSVGLSYVVDRKLVWANKASEEMFGYRPEEYLNQDSRMLFPDDVEYERVGKIVYEQLQHANEVKYDARYMKKDGTEFWVHCHVNILDPDNPSGGILLSLMDITDRKRAEEELSTSLSLLDAALESTADGILVVNREGKATLWNRNFADMWQLDDETFATRDDETLLKAILEQLSDPGQFIDKVRDLYATPPRTSFDILDFKDGRIFERYSQPQSVNNEIVGRVWSFRDVTERQHAEDALKDSEVKYRTVVDNAIEAICVIQDDRFCYFNPEAVKLYGYPAAELERLPPDATIHPGDRELVGSRRRLRLQGQTILPIYSHRIVTKDGRVRWVDVKAVTLSWKQRPGVLIFLTDITERKRSEEMMIQTEKMLSLGGLAAGMAHELNNPLGGILQGAQNVLRRLSPELPSNHQIAQDTGVDLNNLQHYLEKREIISFINGIQESGRKASRIITSMLQFSRHSESKMAPTNLVDLVENVLELAGKDYNLKKKHDFRNIDIVREYADNLPLVPCTQTEIEQVVLNLLTNAGWAIAAGGKQSTPRISLRIRVEGNTSAVIEVEDNGSGMDEKTRKKIFEPFFTTKPVGEGTGLGLSVSYMIITNNHGGSLEVESEPGKGARFIIRLPLKRSNPKGLTI